MTIGTLIKKLEAVEDKTKQVCYDFAYFVPTCLGSYRGYYERPALGYSEFKWDDRVTVEILLKSLHEGMKKTHHGWKGGQYRFTLGQNLYIDNPGDCSGTVLVGCDETRYQVILRTEKRED